MFFYKDVLLKKWCIVFILLPLFKGPGRAHIGLYGPICANISDFWFNFACFNSKTEFLTKFLNDSAWFCVEKLKKHGFETKKLQIRSQI